MKSNSNNPNKMKRPVMRGAIVIASLALLAACKSNDGGDPNFPTKFSSNTVEQNKTNLEDNGVQMVDDMTALKSATGIQATVNLVNLLNNDNNAARRSTSDKLNFIKALSDFGQGKISNRELFKAAKLDGSLQDAWDTLIGVYTYSSVDGSWSKEATGDKIVFKFPSTSDGTTNDAEYDIYGYKSVQITSNIGGSDYTGDYPTAINADLFIGGVKKMGYKFSADYNSNGDPAHVNIEYSIDDYTFTFTFVNTTTEVKVEEVLKKGSKVLIGWGIGSTGTFNTDVLQNSDDPSNDVKTASAYFQIENIKFSAKIDLEKIRAGIDAADTDQKIVDLYNANYKVIVFYVDSKEKIADTEFYLTDDGGMDIRLVFADGSKSDMDTYTSTGFDDFKNAVDDFVNDTAN